VIVAPIVGETIIGIRLAWRSFHAPITRSASSSTWKSVGRRAAASLSASAFRAASILQRLKPMHTWSPNGLSGSIDHQNLTGFREKS
jgi:hypothetical protein